MMEKKFSIHFSQSSQIKNDRRYNRYTSEGSNFPERYNKTNRELLVEPVYGEGAQIALITYRKNCKSSINIKSNLQQKCH